MSKKSTVAAPLEIHVHNSRGWREGDDVDAELRRVNGTTSFVWLIVPPEDEETVAQIEKRLGMKHRAIVTAEARRLRNHVDLVDGVEVIALSTMTLAPKSGTVRRGEVTCLVTPTCAVTVESGPAGILAEAREILESDVGHIEHGAAAVMRAIAIAAVEKVEQLVLDLGEAIDRLESATFSSRGLSSAQEIYRLKRQIAQAHRGVVPLAATLQRVADNTDASLPDAVRATLGSLARAAARCVDHIDSLDRMLGDMLSAHLTVVSVQQNSDMRRISAWAALVAVPTMFAGLYGMNFKHMPGLDWAWGFPVALGIAGAISFGIYHLLKRIGWF